MSKEDAPRLCYNMQLDMCEFLNDPVKHKVMQKATHKKPKLLPEVQQRLNIIDW